MKQQMVRYPFIFLTFLFFSLSANCQSFYSEATDIIVFENNQSLQAALNGGFNTAQVNEIDLNLDGVLDLIVFDRFKGLVKPYINSGIANRVDYTYAPEYSKRFPEMSKYLITRDYNNDGKLDLFIGESEILLYENTSTTSNGLSFQLVSKLNTVNNPPSQVTLPINTSTFDFPGIYDIDNDQDLDIFVYNDRKIGYHRNLSKDIANNFVPKHENRNKCWGFFAVTRNNTDGLVDSILFNNCDGLTRGERRKGSKHVESTSITPIDIDQNSSTDVLISFDGSYQLRLFLNADSVAFNYHTNSRIHKIIDSFPNYGTPVRLLSPSAFILDVNNDGKKDMIVASNHANLDDIGPYSKDDIWYYKNISQDNSFRFQLETKSFLRNNILDFGRTSKPIFFDYNKDGLKDILIGNGGYLSPTDSTSFVERFALLENTGTVMNARFNLIDTNYLNLPSRNFGHTKGGFAYASPSVGDIDGDNDDDILLTQKDGTIYLLEDTSNAGATAAFKFHNQSFQNIRDEKGFYSPANTQLFDFNNDEILELIVSSSRGLEFFVNFGSKTNPVFNLAIDSLYWIGGDSIRYHFRDDFNYNMLNIGDTMALNNSLIGDNNSKIKLVISKIDSLGKTIECINTLEGGIGNNRLDEFNTNTHMTFANRGWHFSGYDNISEIESIFFYKYKNQNHMILGSPDGNNYFLENFPDSLRRRDTISGLSQNFMTNYGLNTYLNGTDLNGDSIFDLVVGLNTGGIKILYGSESTGINNFIYSTSSEKDIFYTIFPIPANQYLDLKINKGLKTASSSFELRNSSGQVISVGNFQGSNHRISTENFPRGIYFITVKNEDKVATRKLIINY